MCVCLDISVEIPDEGRGVCVDGHLYYLCCLHIRLIYNLLFASGVQWQ